MRSIAGLMVGVTLLAACADAPSAITSSDIASSSTRTGSVNVTSGTSTVRWNRKAMSLFRARGGSAGRVNAYVALAQYRAALGAVNAKEGRSQPSPAAAVAAASVVVLKQFYPLDAASIDAELAAQRAESPSASEHNKDFGAGETIGQQIGAAVLALAAPHN